MELKDFISIVLSSVALTASFLALYFSHLQKTSKALLSLANQSYRPTVSGLEQKLTYVFSNMGNQELYVKNISLLKGCNAEENAKNKTDFVSISTNTNAIEPFVIKPGEIKSFRIHHMYNDDHESNTSKYNGFKMKLEADVISANGQRFDLSHDITDLYTEGQKESSSVWSGVSLNRLA